MRIALLLAALAACAFAVDLKPETQLAFDRYVRQAESRIEAQAKLGDGFLFAGPERREALRHGRILAEARVAHGDRRVPSGLIHHWVGAVFIPDAPLERVLAFLQDYSRHSLYYRPEVIASRVVSRDGNDFRVSLRLLKKKVLRVVLDTEHEVHYEQIDPARWWSRSRSTRIAEVQEPGATREKILPPGTGHGYIWRLNSYWTFHGADGGTYVECEAISLSRDVPSELAWLIAPMVRSLPRESLINTLSATRAALKVEP